MTHSSPVSPASRCAFRMETVGRVLFSSVFVAAGIQHLVATDAVVARLRMARLGHLAALAGPPRLLVLVAGLVLVAAGSSLLAGYRVRAAAMVLAALLVPISITALAGTAGETGPLMKNVALFGGLLQIAAASPAGATVRAHVERTGATEES